MYYDLKESGKRIKKFRNDLNMTQEILADKLGVTRESVGKIERGQVGASIDLLIELCVLFDTTLDYLVLGRGAEATLHIDRQDVKDIICRLEKLL